MSRPGRSAPPSQADYRALAEFRRHIRAFLYFSETTARANGVEPQQHQLLLAIKGLPEDARPTVRELAERMLLEHHSTVELITRLARRGLVKRTRGHEDRREVLVTVTASGEALLRRLSHAHADELQISGPTLIRSLRRLVSKTPRRKQFDSD